MRVRTDLTCLPSLQGSAQEIKMQARMIDNEIKMMRQESLRLSHERSMMVEKIEDNTTKIKQNKVLPYLVSKVVEVSPSPHQLPSSRRGKRKLTRGTSRSWMWMRKCKKGQRTMSTMPKSRNVQSSRRRQDRSVHESYFAATRRWWSTS